MNWHSQDQHTGASLKASRQVVYSICMHGSIGSVRLLHVSVDPLVVLVLVTGTFPMVYQGGSLMGSLLIGVLQRGGL